MQGYKDAQPVTASDTNDVPGGGCTSLWIGSAGNLSVITSQGTAVTFNSIPAGTKLDIWCKRVKVTGTTAGAIVALYE